MHNLNLFLNCAFPLSTTTVWSYLPSHLLHITGRGSWDEFRVWLCGVVAWVELGD